MNGQCNKRKEIYQEMLSVSRECMLGELGKSVVLKWGRLGP